MPAGEWHSGVSNLLCKYGFSLKRLLCRHAPTAPCLARGADRRRAAAAREFYTQLCKNNPHAKTQPTQLIHTNHTEYLHPAAGSEELAATAPPSLEGFEHLADGGTHE